MPQKVLKSALKNPEMLPKLGFRGAPSRHVACVPTARGAAGTGAAPVGQRCCAIPAEPSGAPGAQPGVPPRGTGDRGWWCFVTQGWGTLSQPPPRSCRVSSPQVPPSLPAKSGWRGSRSPSGSTAAPEPPAYAQVHKEGARPEPPEAKYQQLMCFHVYAEPREEIAASPAEPIPAEPIPFYAMARGWGPRAGPEENIYSEVALSRQEVPARQPVAPQNAFSTLPPKPRPHRRLFRSVSSQDCKRRQLSAAPSTDRKDGGASSTGAKVGAQGRPLLWRSVPTSVRAPRV